MTLEYKPHEMRPLSNPKEKVELPAQSYIRLGFGTQFTPLVEATYHNKNFENFLFGVRYNHLSSRSTKIENQKLWIMV